MAQSNGWARRLIRGLARKQPEQLLRSRSYADPRFLSLFFEWLDDLIYRDPREGVRWATVAPELAMKTPVGAGGRQAHRERVVRAYIALGSALRGAGDYDASEEVYGRALGIADESVSDLVRAEAHHRVSYLIACQGRSQEALELAAGSVDTLREVADDALLKLGQALVSKGYVLAAKLRRHSEAIDAFGEALTLADTKASAADRRLHGSASLNLAIAISESSSVGDQSQAMKYLQQAKRLVRGQKRSVPRYRLLWVEGLINGKLGSHTRARSLFRQALEGFEVLGLPWLHALVALDLAAVLHVCGEWADLKKVAAETFQRFRLLAANTEAIAALSLWNDAVQAQKWDEEKLSKARQIILAGVETARRRKRRG